MTKISLLLFLFLCSYLLFAQEQADTSKKQDLTLEIIPTNYGRSPSKYNFKQDTSNIFLRNSDESYFNVLLTNNSEDTVNIYNESNSWGYYNLYFEIEYPDGRKVFSTKQTWGWEMNAPSSSPIPPNGHYIFKVTFKSDTSQVHDTWTNSILDLAIGSKKIRTKIPCRIKAIYENEATRTFGTTREMWTGVIESKVDDYIVVYYQFDKPLESEKQTNKKRRRKKKR